MRKKVLITGGAGFIGSHIVDKLVESNFEVVVVDNLSTGKIENVNHKAHFYKCDITSSDIEDIFNKEKPNFLLHLAAQICVPNATKDPINDAMINIIGSINIINNCKKYNIEKFIASSSAAVYGKPIYLPINEEHPTKPLSNYGLSKLCMEKYIELSGLNYIILRFSNVYGSRQNSQGEAGVISIFDKKMKNNDEIIIEDDGEQTRDFIYVEDIAKACSWAIASDVKNEILNISTNNEISINQLFEIMSEIYHYNKKVRYVAKRNGDIKKSILDNSKYLKLSNNNIFVDLYEGLKKNFNY